MEQTQEQTQTEGVNGNVPVEPTEIDLLKKEIQDMKEGFKNELSGLNRKNSELEKEKRDLELSKLEDDEKLKLQLEDMKTAREKEETELKILRRTRTIENNLVDAGLPLDLANRINGENEDDIKSDITALKDWFDKEAEKRAEKIVNERLGGKPPVDGKTPEGNTMKQSDFVLMNPTEQMKFIKDGGTTYD